MKMLTVPQPWATLLSRGSARFAVRHDATNYRGTVAIRAGSAVDDDVIVRLTDDPEFAERMASFGLKSADDIAALPRDAFVGVAALADLWSFGALEEVATEDDAILLGEVGEYAVFWELVDAVDIEPIAAPPAAIDAKNDAAANDADGDVTAISEEGADDGDGDEPDDFIALPVDPPFETVSEELAESIRVVARQTGARFDDDGLVFLPVYPSASLATLIGDDAVGDREITRRVWAHITEHGLQDPEDHTYVFLDLPLRSALDTNEEGMTAAEFTLLVLAQMLHAPAD